MHFMIKIYKTENMQIFSRTLYSVNEKKYSAFIIPFHFLIYELVMMCRMVLISFC